MDQNKVRIVDIAKELGVSTATVSNVLHGKTNKVSEETAKRVHDMVEKKSYIPSMAGILLSQNDSRIIGVMINDDVKYEKRVLQDPFISSSIDYLCEVASKNNLFVMVKCTSDIHEAVKYGSMWNMEGMVLIGYCEEKYNQIRNQIHIPLVIYDGFFDEHGKFTNIMVDHFKGGYIMGEYIIKMGHKKIMFLSDNNLCMDYERCRGLKSAMKAAEIPFDEDMHFIIPKTKKERINYYKSNLNKFKKYTAAFAASDLYAIELMNFLHDTGVKVPDEISVAGFDDIPECEIVRPRLTTIHQDGLERAKLSIEMLIKQKNKTVFEDTKIIEPHLIIRESIKNINKISK